MKPIRQTLFPDLNATPRVYGNCYQACIASLLELSLMDVPHFVSYQDYPMNSHRWLDDRGLIQLQASYDGSSMFWGYHLIFGPSPRSGLHCIVGLNGEPNFDPHPSNDMLKTGTESEWGYWFIVPQRRPW